MRESKLENIISGIIISDFHIPFHHTKTINCSLAVAEYLKRTNRLDYYAINGDFLDCYSISKFVKDPKRVLEFQKEIDIGKSLLQTISAAVGGISKYYLEGNHEERISKDKKINTHLYSLEMYSIPNMLDLERSGFEWLPMGKKLKRKKYVIYHGNKASRHSGYTAKSELDENNYPGITGHTHRGGIHYKTTLDKSLVHAECFSACRSQAGNEYIPGVKNWQKGFLVVYEDRDTGNFQIVPVEVHNGKCIFEGIEFSG